MEAILSAVIRSNLFPSLLALVLISQSLMIGISRADLISDESIEELKSVQEKVKRQLEKSMAATVAIVSTSGMGTGVLVSEDGLILTAGHVSMKPGQQMQIVFADGKKAKAETLGRHLLSDAGMMRIVKPKGPLPYVELEDDASASDAGKWCFALGHPGGRDADRGIVLRVGRVLQKRKFKIKTSCELMGGDSGGPLFSMNGKVMGIHSFIGGEFTDNYHVTMDPFHTHWDAMQDKEVVTLAGYGKGGFLGVRTNNHETGVIVSEVVEGSAAEDAGLQVGDIVLSIDGTLIKGYLGFVEYLRQKSPNEVIELDILRDEEQKSLNVTLGERKK